MPFVAGCLSFRFGRFSAYNVVGAVLWAGSSVALGYVVGTSYGVLNIGRRLALALALAGLGEWLLVGGTIGLIYRSASGAGARSAKAAKV